MYLIHIVRVGAKLWDAAALGWPKCTLVSVLAGDGLGWMEERPE